MFDPHAMPVSQLLAVTDVLLTNLTNEIGLKTTSSIQISD